MVEESPEGATLTHETLQEKAVTVEAGTTVGAIGLALNGVLRSRSDIAGVGERSLGGEVTRSPGITALGGGGLSTPDSEGLAFSRGT